MKTNQWSVFTPPPQPGGVFSLVLPLANGGSVSARIEVWGGPITPQHLAHVRHYLEVTEQDWHVPEGQA